MKKLIILLFVALTGTVFAQEVSKDSIATLKLREKILKLNSKANAYEQNVADKTNDIANYKSKLEDAKKDEHKASKEAEKMAEDV
jgi:uncharacterized protein YihD (DUF1040 family)